MTTAEIHIDPPREREGPEPERHAMADANVRSLLGRGRDRSPGATIKGPLLDSRP